MNCNIFWVKPGVQNQHCVIQHQVMASPTARQAMVQMDTSPWSARKRGADLGFDSEFSEGCVNLCWAECFVDFLRGKYVYLCGCAWIYVCVWGGVSQILFISVDWMFMIKCCFCWSPVKLMHNSFDFFLCRKRSKKGDKGGKGLRHFSMKVCEKVQRKGVTSYNEVADELVAEFSDPRIVPSSDQSLVRNWLINIPCIAAYGIAGLGHSIFIAAVALHTWVQH